MVSQKKNILVGLFVLVGILCIGWMLILFRDLPTQLSRYGAWEVTIYFPTVSGIGKDTPAYFRGYPVGRVVEIKPPTLLAQTDDPTKKTYQVPVIVSVGDEHRIPSTAQVKIFSRGLGGSYLEFIYWKDGEAQDYLTDGDVLQGEVSQTSEFIPEATQKKFDDLFTSLTELSEQAKSFLGPAPTPTEGDEDKTATDNSQPNLRTIASRLDKSLTNINSIIGDTKNKENIKAALADFVRMTHQMQETAVTIDQAAQKIKETVPALGEKVQNVADQLATTLKHLDHLFGKINEGQGTAGRLINDPRLYESLTDTTETLKLAINEFRQLVTELNKHGVIGFKGK